MNRLATIALTIASVFLVIMAILVNSPPLFYMTVAVLATLGASRLQAIFSVRGLRFERAFPPSVSVGEPVTIETVVWSERRMRRPLVSVDDILPPGMAVADRTPSLPVAPSFDQPIRTSYTFRPLRRGRYRWKNVRVRGTDALGLISVFRTYSIDPVDLTVYPVPIPVSVDIKPTTGWGTTELDSGLVTGSGIDTRGIREYVHGDPIRHVHWRSSARMGKLMVKEFDTGSGLSLAFMIQRSRGSDIGPDGGSTFETACGHSLFIAQAYLDRGAAVWFPLLERDEAAQERPELRGRNIRELLTEIQPDVPQSLSDDLARTHVREGTTLLIFLAVQDAGLPGALVGMSNVRKVCMVYDAQEFDRNSTAASASDPTYLVKLERAGAEVHTMPMVRAVS